MFNIDRFKDHDKISINCACFKTHSILDLWPVITAFLKAKLWPSKEKAQNLILLDNIIIMLITLLDSCILKVGFKKKSRNINQLIPN